MKNKRRGRKIINHHIAEGTRESHPRVHDLQQPRLGKPRRGLQSLLMDCKSWTLGWDSFIPSATYKTFYIFIGIVPLLRIYFTLINQNIPIPCLVMNMTRHDLALKPTCRRGIFASCKHPCTRMEWKTEKGPRVSKPNDQPRIIEVKYILSSWLKR